MAERYFIEPDTKFIKQVIDHGGESLKKCFQCASCSVTCPLSSDDNPFPRKEMLWIQWGLKDRLLKDPDILLCHQCNECSVYCPRGARPGDVLAALRNYVFAYYAFPRFMGKILSEAKYLPLLFAFPIFLFLFLLALSGNLSIPEGEIVFKKFIPYIIIDSVFLTTSGFVLLSALVSLSRLWKDIGSNPTEVKASIGDLLKRSLFPTLIEILLHTKFRDCQTNKIRFISHLTIFYGFIALLVVTAIVFVGIYVFGVELPLSLGNPVKIIANLGALALFIGCTLAIYSRLKGDERTGNSTYYDWTLIIVLYGVCLSGIFTEVLRLLDIALLAYLLYFVHLVLVFYLIAYIPYSKFAHLFYRSLAMIYSNYLQRSAKDV